MCVEEHVPSSFTTEVAIASSAEPEVEFTEGELALTPEGHNDKTQERLYLRK
jgi:hypothetical protein